MTELDRKIQLSLKPIGDSEGEPINEPETGQSQAPPPDNRPPSQGNPSHDGNDPQQDRRPEPPNIAYQTSGGDRRPSPVSDSRPSHIPSRLREIADASGGRIVIAGASAPSKEDDPPKKGMKI